jgi:hypothetical protein
MGSQVRSLTTPLVFVTILLTLAPVPRARAAGEVLLTEAALTQLESRAETAQPREQCFLYAELVHYLTELAGNQLANGEEVQAGTTLRHIDAIAQKIHMSLARDSKKLKDTELLMHHTTRRLSDILHVSASDERGVLQATLKRLDDVQNELLTQVFVR